MLKRLLIEQFVIIDRLELTLNEGLTVLTGETGAGKSILLDATGLILGDPPSPASIRAGADEAVLEVDFAPPATNPVWDLFKAREIPVSGRGEFMIRRVLKEDGEDVITIDGHAVDLDTLKEIGTHLCEIHGQFANQSLLDPSNQLNLLDLCGNFPREYFDNVANALRALRALEQELEEETLFYNQHIREVKDIEETLKRFDQVGMREGFIEDVQSEYARLLTARESSEAFQEILSQLIAANGAIKSLTTAKHALDRQANLDREKIGTLSDLLQASIDNAREAANEARYLAPEYEIDTRPLRQYEQTLNDLRNLAAIFELHMDELYPYYKAQSEKLARIRGGRERIARLREQITQAEVTYKQHAHILTGKRIEAGEALSAAINEGLPPLKLMSAQFAVLVEEKPNDPWTERGFNKITFTARMNPGQPFSPIAETASGGELARLVLALKVVLQTILTIPTLIFDEVDTGIGGAAAAAVGERIALLADNTQVLVITHSPQVASRGAQHLHVSKKTDGISTSSQVLTLSYEERLDEISRMLAGDAITPESKAAAKSLLDEASNAAQARRHKTA